MRSARRGGQAGRRPGKVRRALGAIPRASEDAASSSDSSFYGLELVGDWASGAANGRGSGPAPPTADRALGAAEPGARGGLSALVPQRRAWKGRSPPSPSGSLPPGAQPLVHPGAAGAGARRTGLSAPRLAALRRGIALCSPTLAAPLGRRQLGLALHFQCHLMPSPQSSGVKECPRCMYMLCIHKHSTSRRVCH